MRRLFSALGLLGVVTFGACSPRVERSTDTSSPAANTPYPSQSPAASDEGVVAGHGMEGHPSMMSPHGGTSPIANPHEGLGMGMSPHGGMAMPSPHGATPPSRAIVVGTAGQFDAPDDWVPKTPASSMLQNEFSVPAAQGDAEDGRVTVMMAGGSVEENINRWIAQFSQPDGSQTADKATREKLDLSGREVHLVNIAGTYSDVRGPFAPPVERSEYRMLAAIIATAEGNYFVKFCGPRKTVDAQTAAFRSMIESLGQ